MMIAILLLSAVVIIVLPQLAAIIVLHQVMAMDTVLVLVMVLALTTMILIEALQMTKTGRADLLTHAAAPAEIRKAGDLLDDRPCHMRMLRLRLAAL